MDALSLASDHKLLIAIFVLKKGIPVYTANRLSYFENIRYQLEYIMTHDFRYSDILSQLINSNAVPGEEYIICSMKIET